MKVIERTKVTAAMIVNVTVPETDYPAWAAGTTYALGARVISTATHRVYESAIAGNIGNDPTAGATQWLDAGPTNRWAMFDDSAGSSTMVVTSLSVTLAPAVVIGALAVLDAVAATVRVEVTVAGVGVYDRTVQATRAVLTFLDLPQAANAQIKVTLTSAAGAAVGLSTLIIGNVLDLGTTEQSPSIGITDYSRRETDDFGVTTVVERGWAKRMTLRSRIDTSAVARVQKRVARLRATPALWIGEEGYDALSIYGFFKSFSVDIALLTSSFCSFEIEGLAA
ncbi:hypothetical protein HZY97_20160 [Sphingomonas sp. R-74633]|uniref:hypothetical protein n=1 Tax=Sphingomonas sp. R-74633 TaxID=2751188 RepID=UPI0015D1AAB0|nr:hypothetical protein [Sphingomonas sp. R-74633]NYT43100.1 hypothetical protein [Sphingomonas sp. R-74633]